ncbi:SDR family oxidoreductase [Filimonas effusa]|uniref:SDR family oxidoreductase n=1 Tax=Filimonas effusa TaxID=2508721 RepID=A0A4Q1DA99_9BACT|nr:SDR family oxidoreductase [Filimonas effusa]RXK85685.1 SDR family oxidoreductase [Filimonas effusa]
MIRKVGDREDTLIGKVVVITGASSGAGRCIALQLAERKAHLVLAARNLAVLEELALLCRDFGAEVLVIETDVTDYNAMQSLALKAFEWKQCIDVWINNAGVLAAGSFEEMPWESHEKVVHTNLLGYMSAAHVVLPYFKKQKAGMLINNISVGGFIPVPFAGAYTAAKFALRGFFESLKGELAGWHDIHIVDLFAAFLDTPGIQHAANYTGKVLKPAPPVSHPRVIARAVEAAIRHPRIPARYPGTGALLFKVAYSVMPHLLTRFTAAIMKTYFANAPPAVNTNGNLFDTVHFSMAVNAGADATRQKPKQWVRSGLLYTGIALSLYLLLGKRKLA